MTTPVLMLNGRYDFVFPPDSKDKRHILFDTGHSVPRNEQIRLTLEWLDRYLCPVR
ncbi:MAG: hypothetical protein HYR60_06390 [Acidobacteria bacterium]|nr:hypothetical protein [Acidobacteriota bacterium]